MIKKKVKIYAQVNLVTNQMDLNNIEKFKENISENIEHENLFYNNLTLSNGRLSSNECQDKEKYMASLFSMEEYVEVYGIHDCIFFEKLHSIKNINSMYLYQCVIETNIINLKNMSCLTINECHVTNDELKIDLPNLKSISIEELKKKDLIINLCENKVNKFILENVKISEVTNCKIKNLQIINSSVDKFDSLITKETKKISVEIFELIVIKNEKINIFGPSKNKKIEIQTKDIEEIEIKGGISNIKKKNIFVQEENIVDLKLSLLFFCLDSMNDYKNLKYLRLGLYEKSSKKINKIDELSNVEELILEDFHNLKTISNLNKIKKLVLVCCYNLGLIEGDGVKNMIQLEIYVNDKIRNIDKFLNLRRLTLHGTKIKNISFLNKLEFLDIDEKK